MNNFDVVYEPRRDRFYAVREQHPYPADNPSYISASLQVVSIAGVNVRIGGGRWRVEGEIGPKLTGAARNHNAGIARTPHGMLLATDSVRVVFAVSCAGAGCNGRAEWSYDVWAIQGTLSAAR